jgi:hypothetical protein
VCSYERAPTLTCTPLRALGRLVRRSQLEIENMLIGDVAAQQGGNER